MPIIEVEHLTKQFRLGKFSGVGESLKWLAARLKGGQSSARQFFMALDDVSFTIEHGEVVGVIGPNGAGKSTLLKILSRITTPTSGRCTVRGKVTPLIEVGAGLIGDLTGRENIFLNASIFGLSRRAIKRKMDEIIEFSELETFIDTPLKRYSSGMKVKLGFAIATAIESEILIVDEVLAVGDLAFQRKCFDRMEEIIKRQGRTILVVSHNIRHIERLCSRVFLFINGKLIRDGKAKDVCDEFYAYSNDRIFKFSSEKGSKLTRIRSSGEIQVMNVVIANGDGEVVDGIMPDGPLKIGIQFYAHRDLDKPELVVGLHTTDFVYISSVSNILCDDRPSFSIGCHTVECELTQHMLMPGTYSVRVAFISSQGRILWYGENLRTFKVEAGNLRLSAMPELGLVRHEPQWKYLQIESSTESSVKNDQKI